MSLSFAVDSGRIDYASLVPQGLLRPDSNQIECEQNYFSFHKILIKFIQSSKQIN